jgi:transcription antitermination factor NusG
LEKNSETFTTKFKVGDFAMVMKGPFEGNEWVISEVNEKKGLVKLTINLLWRDTPLELDFSQIKVK